jgi:hypothetical protein
MYVAGHIALLYAVLLIPFPLLSVSTERVVTIIALLGAILYNSWVYKLTFQGFKVRAGLAGAGALMLGALLWGLALFAFILIVRSRAN